MKKIKYHVTYTIETDYTFDYDELAREYPEELPHLNDFIHGWIEEDFYKVENRADNVLPLNYSTSLTVEEIKNV